MAHSSDRTLLASLGFQDPDRRDRTHTLACQYLCEKETAAKLARVFWPEMHEPVPPMQAVRMDLPKPDRYNNTPKAYPPSIPGWYAMRPYGAETEVAIHKGRNFLVGFWDVHLAFAATQVNWEHTDTFTIEREEPNPLFGSRFGGGAAEPPTHRASCATGFGWKTTPSAHLLTETWIEVKARPVDVADIVRQIAVYEPYTDRRPGRDRLEWSPLIAATCYPMPAADKATLAAKGIRHIFLGDGFRAYVKARENEQADNGEGL